VRKNCFVSRMHAKQFSHRWKKNVLEIFELSSGPDTEM
jgi:hypothetical protein